ncbi:MAG TPA: lytic transglycosylase domain-containing protein [Alphaproteobacteria bacterium]
MAVQPMLAACLMLAAQTYNVPPAVMVGIMHIEGGKVGQAVGPNVNGTYDLGPMQINSRWVPSLARYWRVPHQTALKMVRDDPCVNVTVAAWILRQRLNESGNLTLAIAHYHSKTPRFGYVYARKVIGAMRKMDLIQD